MNIKKSLLELIGETPLLKLNGLFKNDNIFAKVERFNPTGSIKDRAVLGIIIDYLKKDMIKKQTVIIEPTSGNTGISLAAISSALGIRSVIVMPDNMSMERIQLIEAYGSSVILTPASLGMKGAIDKANELVKETPNSIMLRQFENESNPLIHYNTTGKEIFDAMDGKIDVLVSGIGTGGTITGTARYLKEQNKNIYVVGIEPLSSPFLSKGQKGPHKIQGIGAGFKPVILNLQYVDEIITISNEDAYIYTKELVKKEGLLCGISSGAALAGCAKIKERFPNKNIIVILPDAGERYLSTGVFQHESDRSN